MPDYEPDEREQAVLDVLRDEIRANPYRIRNQTGLRKQYAHDALQQLVKANLVRKVTDGLYEYAGEDAPDRDAALGHINDALYAAERGDDQELRESLYAAKQALGADIDR